MEFGFYFAKQGGNIMRIVELTDESKNNILENLLKRSPNSYGKFESAVAEILLNIKTKGDVYDPEFRKAALSLTNALRDQGVKTELISKKENISLDEYTTFKKEDGATKITYVSKDGAVEL